MIKRHLTFLSVRKAGDKNAGTAVQHLANRRLFKGRVYIAPVAHTTFRYYPLEIATKIMDIADSPATKAA